MTDDQWEEQGLGAALRELRGNTSLRDLQGQIGVSATYMSLIETGARRPGPRVLKKMADYYGVNVHDLLRRAGHLESTAQPIDNEAEVERAYQFVLADPRFRFGTRPRGILSTDSKRFIVEMYEQFTGKRLLE